ncbi:uncharacterized protein BCR38DRAFT_528055 [Pseudomassariella vexata]|uniref:Bacterial low temperature requirement A protein-domain-containing protein n=1 Tax=Pseudomassariella vexata TaxID=1141098 RepID=A0A1Y2DE80_9PEZI|nr:uncharacterized protein BCR38DRAFT_528055 [Pseudomassariella vexata]ORY57580.1 hypothetical protein BCR38DRAFT_528055 [Pseudomassariella vexata]
MGSAGKYHQDSKEVDVKSEVASNVELFYDLWFVANLNVFAAVITPLFVLETDHEIYAAPSLWNFVGYMLLLWTTWLMTTFHYVRFYKDGIAERCLMGTHLGVMVGFTIIGTQFNADKQIQSVYQAMPLFLMASRLALAVQYGMVLYDRHGDMTRRVPLISTIAFHFVAAMIYLGISFGFQEGQNNRDFVVWYAFGVVEMVIELAASRVWNFLTFVGTHLPERFNLLTLIILGEGVIIIAKNVTLVVQNFSVKDERFANWSPALIGIVISGTALIYIIYQLYTGWMCEGEMSRHRQIVWAALHLPLHITLLLLLKGATQFIIWQRLNESVTLAIDQIGSIEIPAHATSDSIAWSLANTTLAYLRIYPPADELFTWQNVIDNVRNISSIPDSFWRAGMTEPGEELFERFTLSWHELLYTVINSISSSFEILMPSHLDPSSDMHLVQARTAAAIHARFRLVLVYSFVCAGITLLAMTTLYIIAKDDGWTKFDVLRTMFAVDVAIGLGLVCLVAKDDDTAESFLGSPWMLPTMTICYFAVLVVSYIPDPTSLTRRREGS